MRNNKILHRIINLVRKLDYKLFFPYLDDKRSEKYYVSKETSDVDYIKYQAFEGPEELNSYFELCTKTWWPMYKFHFCYTEGCVIEPLVGWGVTKDNKLIAQSLWNNYLHRVNKPLFSRHKLSPRKHLYLPKAISIQYAWGNYWHFHNDILGQLHLADAAGLPIDTPVIIAKGLAERPFFQDILALSPDLQNRNWVLQDRVTDIHCDEAHFFHAMWDHRENFDAVAKYINFEEKLRKNIVKNRRIFINRKAERGRNIINISEVLAILYKYEFEIVDCDELSVKSQIDIFQNSAFVIGIHGAGLTNIIYRQNSPMKLLEIFSKDYLNPCYYWLCLQYGYSYYGIVGSEYEEKNTTSGNFSIDAKEFEARIVSMLGL